MNNIGWIIYGLSVLLISGFIGSHLGRFREAYTEMTGMMCGMMMGMLNGFLIGYAAAAAMNSMFWGNVIGVLIGLSIGAYFGRTGSLMGIMDGAMGGVMGGSMGAMLAIMVIFPREGLFWTAVLLGAVYIAGMVGLVVLIEQSAPGHAALHRLAPMFTRAMATEAAEEASAARSARGGPSTVAGSGKRLVNYYALLGVRHDASDDELLQAYLQRNQGAKGADSERLDRAFEVLTDPGKREVYDRRLAEMAGAHPAAVPAAAERGGHSTTARQRGAAVAPALASASTSEMATTMTVAVGDRRPEAERTPDHRNGRGPNNAAGGRGDSGKHARMEPNRGGGSAASPARQAANGRAPSASPNNGARAKGGNQASRKGRQVQQARYKRRDAEEQTTIRVPLVGGIAVLLLFATIGWWVLSSASAVAGPGSAASGGGVGAGGFVGARGETQAQLDQEAVVATTAADGTQTLDVVLNSQTFQYEPKVMKVKQGAPVRLNLSIKNGDPG